ncbi:hypothetical protein LWC34_04045 [Kibdelosporangium philippinense]|uniref:Integrase catalytic domain-containing protein n=1 Tax=Kibdelosporangium philippinense TaxID=211113 RepID=A0ABS8Z851_9PSEU|nr:hypothetical protein [Kibdelosporangium philippinense]MCE7002007.1 hypothetical protein [Kibdelosporangium philippinense]
MDKATKGKRARTVPLIQDIREMVCCNEWQKRTAVLRDATYQRHYNQHRPHQTREQQPPERHHQTDRADENNVRTLLRAPVLNGLINEYRYAA